MGGRWDSLFWWLKWCMDLALVGWSWERNARIFKIKERGFGVLCMAIKKRQDAVAKPHVWFCLDFQYFSLSLKVCFCPVEEVAVHHWTVVSRNDILGIVKGGRGFAKMSRSGVILAEFTRAVSKHHFKTSLCSVLTVSP